MNNVDQCIWYDAGRISPLRLYRSINCSVSFIILCNSHEHKFVIWLQRTNYSRRVKNVPTETMPVVMSILFSGKYWLNRPSDRILLFPNHPSSLTTDKRWRNSSIDNYYDVTQIFLLVTRIFLHINLKPVRRWEKKCTEKF